MFGSLDNHRLVEDCLDVYTYDSYPNFAFAMGADPRHNTTLNDRKWGKNLMEVRSVCPHFGIMEQQAGAGGSSTRSAPAPKPGQMMLWAMQSIAHGADYVSFFRWRTVTYGPEMYWHGLLDYDNRPNRKLAELQRLHARVEAIQEMAGAEYIALLGLVKDYDNVFDAQLDAWHGDLANASEMELFVASQLAHTPMDALYLDHAALEDLQRYPVLFCPHQEILTPQRAQFLQDTGTSPGDYDGIFTGDLGAVGSQLLYQCLEDNHVDVRSVHQDCGLLLYDRQRQDVHAGGSGCGCSASVLCGHLLRRMERGELRNILFCATGALMSPTSSQQGQAIPGVCHVVQLLAP